MTTTTKPGSRVVVVENDPGRARPPPTHERVAALEAELADLRAAVVAMNAGSTAALHAKPGGE